MSKFCELVKKLKADSVPVTFSNSDSEQSSDLGPVVLNFAKKYLDELNNQDMAVDAEEIPEPSIFVPKYRKANGLVSSFNLAIPDYFSAEKIDLKKAHDLDHYLDPGLPISRPHANEALDNEYEEDYGLWFEYLLQGLNIALYGAGSKIHVLTGFQEFLREKNCSVIRVNAYNPVVTIRKILNELLSFLSQSEKHYASLDRLLSRLISALDTNNCCIFLLVDCLDSQAIADPDSQLILSRLANHSNVHLIATFENANLLYRWSIDANIKYNFLYVPCPTMVPYSVELTFVEGLKVFEYSSSHGQLRGIDYVLKSLTSNQRKILKELAYISIKESNGISFKEFVDKCIEETLLLNAKQLKDALVEAIDHQIAAYKIGPKGENVVYLKIDPVVLINKIE